MSPSAPPPRSVANLWTGLAIAAACWSLLLATWLAGVVANVIIGGGWRVPALLGPFLAQLLRGQPYRLWPGLSGTSYALALVLVGLPIAAVITWLIRWLKNRQATIPGLADPRQLEAFTPASLAERVGNLRPSLARTEHHPDHWVGLTLGRLDGGALVSASWEDTVLAVMGPRAGKTTGLTVPTVLDAPGPVLATSNKPDLWVATSVLRAQQGTVWTFDPQQIIPAPQSWWWNPIADVSGVEDAARLAGHFLSELREPGKSDFWSSAAEELLTNLIMAAALSGGNLHDLRTWLTDRRNPEPRRALLAGGADALAESLDGLLGSHDETREGVYQTARTATKALRDESIMTWVTPSPGPRQFRPTHFVTRSDTLYLLSKDGAGSAAPLVAALADAVFRAATRAAEQAGGRLDPPLVAPLDEAANICRIADLPDLYSHLGSRGIVPLTILQSYRQGVRVWGEPGMDALWSAATVKMVGAGVDDPAFAANVSRLIGEHDVPVITTTHGPRGGSDSSSFRRQPIMGPEDVRALPRGQALLFISGIRPALLHLQPWYAGPWREVIQAGLEFAQRRQRKWSSGPGADTPASGGPPLPEPSGRPTDTTPENQPDAAPPMPGFEFDLPACAYELGGCCLLGRHPVADEDDDDEVQLISIEDPTMSMSETHLMLGVDVRGFWIVDRDSATGTRIIEPSGEVKTCTAWQQYHPASGTRVCLGEAAAFVVREPARSPAST